MLSQINAARGDDAMAVDEESSDESEDEVRPSFSLLFPLLTCFQVEEFYSPGSLELLEARRRIAEFSLPRSDFLWWVPLPVRCLLALLPPFSHAELNNGSRSSD